MGASLVLNLYANVNQEFILSDEVPISENYDVVFITNPTSAHYNSIRKFAGVAKAMFIEKPVFDRSDVDVEALLLRSDGIYYVACPLRYHPVINYVRTHVPCERAYSVRAICSSYLPDWRSGTDYRNCYSAHQDMGGGVDIDLIHEWDYLTCLFGPVRAGFAIRDQISHLEIDSNDLAVYIAQTARTTIELHLDYFGRSSIRQLQIFLPEDTVECDILAGDICWQVSGKRIHLDNERDAYQSAELLHFWDILEGKCPNDSKIEDALRVLRYAKGEFRS